MTSYITGGAINAATATRFILPASGERHLPFQGSLQIAPPPSPALSLSVLHTSPNFSVLCFFLF